MNYEKEQQGHSPTLAPISDCLFSPTSENLKDFQFGVYL